jgi:hypothetical protein
MSRQEILDDPAAACPNLGQFLGAYFHQDWAEDRERWETVVDKFITESPHSVVVETAGELGDVLAAKLTDADLTGVLAELGANVVPAAFDMTSSAWATAVLKRLRTTR